MSSAPPFLVREAIADDRDCFSTWLPWSLGVPAARMGVATDATTGAVAGVAALRTHDSRVGVFQLHVDPAYRRRGCGTALLAAVAWAARQAGGSALKVGVPCESNTADRVAAAAFLQARGFAISEDILRYRADLASALAVLEPLYRRFEGERAKPHAARILPADQIDRDALAAFAVRQVGGFAEAVAARLEGHGWAYALEMSMVAVHDGVIVGALLTAPTADGVFIETRAVETAHRGSWINLGMMYLAAAAAQRLGVTVIEFEGAADDRDTTKLARRFGGVRVGRRQSWCRALAAEPAAEPAPRPTNFGSSYTPSFPALLSALGCSVVVTTGPVGKLVFLRADGDQLNTHFRDAPEPTGLAFDGTRLAVGTPRGIWEYRDDPSAAREREPPGRHDACFLPHATHPTGDVSGHELAYARSPRAAGGRGAEGEGELWLVDTRYSCLRASDPRSGFSPRWQPSFITALVPEDRCHLKGLALVDGVPRYVTALAVSDEPSGWRQRWRRGGVVIDVPSNQVVCRGLSLPHSPRWDGQRLWVLNSGEGGLGVVDPYRGVYEEVARLPGYPRGLDVVGDFAFVGVSRVRGAASSEPGSERLPADECCCGVWVVDLRSGATVAFVHFEDGVPELFGVRVLVGKRFPELVGAGPVAASVPRLG